MAKIDERIEVLCELLNRKPGIGKTVVMKLIYILQQVFKVPLEYDYKLYTYGPYSSEVMNDIDYAKQIGVISVEQVSYSQEMEGYKLHAIGNGIDLEQSTKAFSVLYDKKIEDVICNFGNDNARELELITTIIYLYATYSANDWDIDKDIIAKKVHEIKPHFFEDDIAAAYCDLDEKGLLKKAIL